MMSGKLIGLRDVAKILSRHKSCVYRMVLRNEIPFLKAGKCIVFNLEQIHKRMKDRRP